MYQNDPDLDELLNKPLLMAIDEDDDYEYEDDEDDEDDLFGDDILQAAIDAKEEEEAEAAAFAASLMGEPAEDEAVEEDTPIEAEEAAAQPAQKLFTRPGIRRELLGYGLFTILGFVPLVLLFIFKFTLSLGVAMEIFTWLFLIGLALSFYNLTYHLQHRNEYTVSFNVRSFFRFWPDVVVVGVVLIGISLMNISGMSQSQPLVTMTGEKLTDANIFAPSYGVENQEEGTEAPAEEMPVEEIPVTAEELSEEVPAEDMMVDLTNPMGDEGTTAPAETAQPTETAPTGKYNTWFNQPVTGAIVGMVGSMEENIPPALLPKKDTGMVKVDLSHENPWINNLFMGGSLSAAFGYAFVLGIAGALIGLIRRFDTPFSKKYIEIINIENGETEIQNLEYVPIKTYFNVVFKALVGLTYGGILGFVLGVAVVVPLSLMFGGQAIANPSMGALLSAMGVVNYPDLAFTNAVTLGGLMIPLIIAVVAKLSPQGMSISEELIRQHYEIKPQGRFIPSDQPIMVGVGGEGSMASPVAIRFGPATDDELETSQLVSELEADEESLTSEIIDEFGREFEQIFGIDTRELLGKQTRKETVDQKRLASALDESFGELGNVPVEISAELGQASIPITEWLNLKEGTLVLLDKPADEEIDVLFNGIRKGKGKLIVSENALSVKVSSTNFNSNNGQELKSEIGV